MRTSDAERRTGKALPTGAGFALGVGVGVALAATFDNLAIGIALGAVFGSLLDLRAKRGER